MGGPWRYDGEGRRFAPLDVDRAMLQQAMGSIGAGIIGRRMFDVTGGWGGNPPGGQDARYFVLTHSAPQEWARPDSPFTFVTPPSTPGTIRFLIRTLAKVPRVITRSLPRREP